MSLCYVAKFTFLNDEESKMHVLKRTEKEKDLLKRAKVSKEIKPLHGLVLVKQIKTPVPVKAFI